jgi:tetratricopeptide (TPR) repeat protein
VARGTGADGAGRRAVCLVLSLACLLTSLLAKAWGIVLPAVLLVLDGWPLRRLSRASWLALGLEKLPFAALALLFAALARWAQVAQQGRLDTWQLHTVADRAIQALYGIAFYPSKTLWPFGLSPLYPIPDQLGLAEPRFLLGALVTLGVTAVLLWQWRARPWGLAAWLGYLAIVSPVLGVQQSGPQLVADRYAYLAGIPLAWLAGGALLWGLRLGPAARRLALASACAVLVGLSLLSFRQSRIWHDSETLWRVALARPPGSPLAALNLGIAIADRAHAADDPAERQRLLARALGLVDQAAARRSGTPLYSMNQAILLAALALPPEGDPDPEGLARAIERGAAAIAAAEAESVVDASWYWHQGRMLVAAGRPAEAGVHFERALALQPDWPPARRGVIGALLAEAELRAPRDARGALERLERALALLAEPPELPIPVGELRADALALRAQLIARLRAEEG